MTAPLASPEPLIGAQFSARALDVRIGGAQLLRGVDLDAEPGQLLGLIGPNGAGKSTLLRAVAGLIPLHSGTVQLDGGDIHAISAGARARRIGFVLQHAPEAHGFTGLEIVLTGRYPHLGRMEIEGAEDRSIARTAMERTATQAFEARSVDSLSGGERQRLFIARGLTQQPAVLLLDEPTASLDVRHQLAMFELFRAMAEQGATLIVAVHDLELAARYCHRMVLMDHGTVVAAGSPEAVLTPERLSMVFGVDAAVYRDPYNGTFRVSFQRHAEGRHPAAIPDPATTPTEVLH